MPCRVRPAPEEFRHQRADVPVAHGRHPRAGQLLEGDRDYLKAMEAPAGAARQESLKSARKHYRESVRLNHL